MTTFLTVIHVAACVLLILVVLIQAGKGAEISASLGGSSQTIFGSSGGANFFTRFTAAMAAIFMTTSVVLTILGSQSTRSVFEGAAAPVTAPAPAQPVAPAAPANPAAPAAAQPAAPAQNAAPATK